MKKILFICLCFALISCGTTNVDYDYDEQANFDAFKSYNYLPDMQSGMSQLDLNRLMKATDSILQSRGYIKSETPDLYVNVVSDRYEDASRNSVGIGIGGVGGNVGVGVGGGIPIGGRTLHQTLTIDLVDVKKDALVWQAVSDSNLQLKTNPAQREAYFKTIMEKIFKKYPPQK
ncbi:MAG: DUF4136 domain-containing protein [Leeuwenhoekiella sp.]